MMGKEKITVFGSFVVDLMGRSPHLPVPGETVKGSVFKMGPGGKGFNQGVAAHKSGGEVQIVTKIGRDSFGKIAIEAMKDLGIDTKHMLYSKEVETGIALILVDEETAQNEIVVVSGACSTITAKEVENLRGVIGESEYLLTQLETNLLAVDQVVELAWKLGTKVILNPAPVQAVSDDVLERTYLITPNEVEAQILTGIEVKDEESASKAAGWFFNKGVENVVITLGSKGAYIANKKEGTLIPAYQVKAIDTTGAGDAFNGGLVTALSEGKSLFEAAQFASALAALAVQKIGTTPSMPERKDIDDFLRGKGHYS